MTNRERYVQLRPLLLHILSFLVFWCWNLLFVFFGVMLLSEEDIWWHEDMFIAIGMVSIIPAISMVYGLFRLREPQVLLRLFYGVEAPLVGLALVRAFGVSQGTPELWALLGGLSLGLFAYASGIRRAPSENTGGLVLETLGAGFMLINALWVGGLMGLVVLPSIPNIMEALGNLFLSFIKLEWLDWEILKATPFIVVTLTMLVWSMTLWMTLPFVLPSLLFRRAWQVIGAAQARLGAWPTMMLVLFPLLGFPVAFLRLTAQPQTAIMAELQGWKDGTVTSESLRAKRDFLKKGLVNSALARYRYWGDTSDRWMAEYWERELDFKDATWAQGLFNSLWSPLIFEGNLREDPTAAMKMYSEVFDTPFDKAERDAIRDAMGATYASDMAKAGLADIDAERVYLQSQSVQWSVEGDLASVRVDEVYVNNDDVDQETQVVFSLPESAAVTALYLSDDANNPTKFAPALAARGAAQAVYDAQRQERRDPAILEQVGPRQYRMRVFPIPRAWNPEPAHPVYVRLEYRALLDGQGIPSPQVIERRNLFWDAQSIRQLNGASVTSESWIPQGFGPMPTGKTLVSTLGENLVTAQPLSPENAPLPQNKHFLIVLDTSASMEAHTAQLQQAFVWLRQSLAPHNTITLMGAWPTQKALQTLDLALDPATLPYLGRLTPQGALSPLQSTTEHYDAVIYLTDDGSYDDVDDTPLPHLPGPLWLVHLGGQLPIAYPDAVSDRLYSEGGIATSLQEAARRIAQPALLDGYQWDIQPATELSGTRLAFDALAARRWIALTRHTGKALSLEEMDRIHAAAKDQGIVTPWSSLLVLVTDTQKQLLADAESKEDRFDREVDLGGPSNSNPFVSAVPEPETWALLIVGGLMLSWHYRRPLQQLFTVNAFL